MANTLTGDFDVVAQFSVAAVNRILAAMHQCERFLHSVSGYIDDLPHPDSPQTGGAVLTGAMDLFGDAIVEMRQISGTRPPAIAGLTATNVAYSILGEIVNPSLVSSAIQPTKEVPSNLKGRVQLQLSAPTIDVPDATGKNLSATINAIARYFPDKNTDPIAEFIRGDLRITAAVNQIASEVGNVVEFDFKADQAVISFTPSSSSRPLSSGDRAAITQAIRNALKTSFLPSSATLPANIAQVQFKTFKGGQKAVGVLLNMSRHAANPATANNLFLGNNDQFAFAAGRDFVLAALKKIADNILSQPIPPVKFSVSLVVDTIHFRFPITLKSATFDLKPGKIVLTIKGHADSNHSTIAPPFNFTATLNFTLQAVGPSVKLIPGSISFDTSSLIQKLVSLFTNAATNGIANARDKALNESNAFGLVSDMFDMNAQLGPFLNSLLKDPSSNELPQDQRFIMTYPGIDIRPEGIVLHGLLFCLFQIPGPHVEFEQIASNSGSAGGPLGGVGGIGADGPDYSALKSWVPGGRIDQYEWSVKVDNKLYPFGVDPNKFVLLHSGPVIEGSSDGGSLPPFTPLCLTVRGTQLSPQGPIVSQAVSGTVCGYTQVTLANVDILNAFKGLKATVAMTAPSPKGMVVVSGHANAQPASAAAPAPNLVLHFGDAKSASDVQELQKAISKRKDVAAAVVAVIPPDQLAKMRYTPGVIYTDDPDGDWKKAFGVKPKDPPHTLVIHPDGQVAWKHTGKLQRDAQGAVEKALAPTGKVRVTVSRLAARIGQPAPNFLFEYASGHQLPLSKLRGRPVVLVFWRSSSPPSLEAVRELRGADPNAVVLAINDGEPVEVARRTAKKNKFTATLVPDPGRDIATAYGVNLWPTIVTVDAGGRIANFRFGYVKGEHDEKKPKGRKAPVKRKRARA